MAASSTVPTDTASSHDPLPAPAPVAVATPAAPHGRRGFDPVADSIAEQRLAADSAADAAALDELASARPAKARPDRAADATDAAADATVPGGGIKALDASLWDIDVTSFSDHDRVQYYLDYFESKGRERMSIWLDRMTRYEPMIRARLHKEGLPGDLVYLALIESGFSNAATSRAKAVGMWQFMKGTAKLYGLRVDPWVDERRDPYKATDAAARHLHDLTERFGSVYLAAAAYNAGAGRVSRGLDRLPEDADADSLASDATFFRLYDTKLLRQETKDYVPKLIAAALIAKQPERYGFAVTPDSLAPYDSIVVPDMTGLDVIARLADTTVAAIRELNPQFLRRATPPSTASVVRLPVGRGESTQLAYAELPPNRRVTSVDHIVQRGETMSGIARHYHVSLGMLAQANPRIGPRRLQAGQRLIVPTDGFVSVPSATASESRSHAASQLASNSKSKKSVKHDHDHDRTATVHVASAAKTAKSSNWHRVRHGETLSAIADDYRVSVRDLQLWNRLGKSNRIHAGQRLRIAPPPARASAGRYRAGGGGR